MSNVIIGIIGVVLFIGLAVAGGVIYGSSFTSSVAESKAAAIANALASTAHATNLMQLKTGSTPIAGQLDAQLIPRFLKSRPFVDSLSVGWRDANNAAPGGTQATLVTMPIVPTPTLNEVCAQFESDTGNQVTAPPVAASAPSKATGCFVLSQTWGLDGAGTMIFYYRI